MGYRAFVLSQVRMAFRLIGDLAVIVTLNQKDTSGFNFNTNSNTEVALPTKTIKGLDDNTSRSAAGSGELADTSTALTKKMTFMSEDLPNPDLYDSVTFMDGSVWRFVPPYENDGYLISVTLTREYA